MPTLSCNGNKFDVPSDNITSGLIQDLVEEYGDSVDVPVSDSYQSVIDNYVNFLSDVKYTITDKESLKLCLQLSTLFSDDAYLTYVIEQLFNSWSQLSDMVYNQLNDDLKWLIFLNSPYDFIPNYLLDNTLFMDKWNQNNRPKLISVDHNKL
jgi:hypothetical protein